jgi:hypothetical protein
MKIMSSTTATVDALWFSNVASMKSEHATKGPATSSAGAGRAVVEVETVEGGVAVVVDVTEASVAGTWVVGVAVVVGTAGAVVSAAAAG